MSAPLAVLIGFLEVRIGRSSPPSSNAQTFERVRTSAPRRAAAEQGKECSEPR